MTSRDRDETHRVRDIFDRLAPRYDRSIRRWERILFAGGREWLGAQASGDVLEVGVGTGRNLPHYPPDVRLTAIDVSPQMLALARRRAAAIDRDVDLRLGDAQALEFPDESFDTVVFGLCLCSIPDERRAVAEARRVLRGGGRIALLEHVRSPRMVIRAGQRLLEPLAVRFGGDHLLREPETVLRAAGFEIEHLERSRWGIVDRAVARKKAPA
jgi:ubiquinone/menaquinone biosynthesis C-methylase UbiE